MYGVEIQFSKPFSHHPAVTTINKLQAKKPPTHPNARRSKPPTAMVKVGGAGHHAIAVQRHDPQALERWGRLLMAYLVFLYLLIALPRLSIICLYLRIFSWRPRSLERIVALGLMVFFPLSLGPLLGVTFAVCRPLGFVRQFMITVGPCAQMAVYYRAHMITGMVVDLIVFLLPLRTLWALKIPVSDKMTVALLLSIASV